MNILSKNAAIAFVGMLLLSACNKNTDKPSQPGAPEKLRVKTETGADALNGWQAVYIYDSNNRLIKETEIIWGTDTAKITEYFYAGDKLTIKISKNNNTRTIIYKLNPQGYISEHTGSDGITYSYTYNSNGYIIKTKNNQPDSYERNYYYNASNGLLDSTRATIGGIWNNSQYYTYDMNRINTLGDINFGKSFYGSHNLRPFTHYEYKYIESNVIKTQTIDYLFVYDEKGRIASKSYESAGQKLTTHYTFY